MKYIIALILQLIILTAIFSEENKFKNIFLKALEYERNDDFENAAKYYEKYFRLTDDEKILLKAARIYPEYYKSIRLYKEFLKKFSVSRFRFIARYELGMLYKINNDYNNAIKQFDDLAKISFGNVYWEKARLETASLEYFLKNYYQSIDILYKILENTENYETIGVVYYYLGMNMIDQGLYEDAKNFFLICSGSFPQSSKAPASLLELIKLYEKQGRYTQALRIHTILGQFYTDSLEKLEANKIINSIKNKIKNKNIDNNFIEVELINLDKDYILENEVTKRMTTDFILSLKIDENIKSFDTKKVNSEKDDKNEACYYVQLGYLTKEENAITMVKKYKSAGINDVFWAKTRSHNNNIGFRVIIGPFITKNDANKKLIELKENSIESIILELYKEYE